MVRVETTIWSSPCLTESMSPSQLLKNDTASDESHNNSTDETKIKIVLENIKCSTWCQSSVEHVQTVDQHQTGRFETGWTETMDNRLVNCTSSWCREWAPPFDYNWAYPRWRSESRAYTEESSPRDVLESDREDDGHRESVWTTRSLHPMAMPPRHFEWSDQVLNTTPFIR